MNKESGVTLIELIMFILILSIGLVGMMVVFNQTVKNSADPIVQKQALFVAETLLDEVLDKSFAVQTSYTGVDRKQFDDIDDYNGFTQIGVTTQGGDPVIGLEDYEISIQVNKTTATLGSIGSPDVKKITVTVTVKRGSEQVVLSGYRVMYE